MIPLNGNPHGLIPRPEVLPSLKELISRCGSLYKVDRAYGAKYGLIDNTLRLIVKGKPVMVQRRTAWAIQQALDEQRRHDDEHPPRKPHYHKHEGGFIPRVEVIPFAQELIWRCGSAYKVEQRHGIPRSTLQQVVQGRAYEGGGETIRVRKRTAQQILSALVEQRKHDRQHGTSKRYLAARRRHAQFEGQLEQQYGL